jgi:hypothetical protein
VKALLSAERGELRVERKRSGGLRARVPDLGQRSLRYDRDHLDAARERALERRERRRVSEENWFST